MKLRSFLPSFSVCLLLACAAWCQEFRSTLSGRVLDPSSAGIPQAKILATQVETHSVFEALSDSEGRYTIPFLPPGSYTVEAEKLGFKKFRQNGFRVSTNERPTLDIRFEIGDVSQAVTVTADASMLETATGSNGQVINTTQIENMPLNGRTPLVLSQLAYGVIPANDPRNVRPFDNAGPSDFSMGGAPSRTNELLLDGAPNSKSNQVSYNPPVDAVQEIKVESFSTDAAYGHTGGGTVNVVMKSGTNDLHGTAYWFNQSARFAATPFFTNRAGQQKSEPLYHQYGANAGGPLIAPKLFNGRNRVFFFVAFEGMKNDRPGPSTVTVPTADEMKGDFSGLLRAGASYQIYDPLTGVQEGSRVRRQPFAGNIIPANRISPIAKNYLQFYPAPNQAGLVDGQNNYLAPIVEHNSFDNEIGRLDFNLSQRNKFFYNFRHNNRDIDAQNTFQNLAQGEHSARTNWGTIFDDVFTINPTTVLNTRLAWNRYTVRIGQTSDGFDMTTFGFPASLAAAATKKMLPYIDLDRFNDLGHTNGSNSPADTFQIFSSVMHFAGPHSLKAGADLRLYRNNITNFKNGSGSYTFRSDWTRGPLDNSTAAPLGQDFAAFLLGLPSSGTFDVNAAGSDQSSYFALFLQDDFRVRRNLTLNLGLRYERDLAVTERYNRAVRGFDATVANPISASALAAYQRAPIPELPASQFRTPGGLLFAGAGNSALYSTPANAFSPRIGFAWSLNSKTVVRGGTGLYYFPISASYVQTGFTATTPLVATLNGYLSPAATLANPFPGGIQQPVGAAAGLSTNVGQGVSFYGSSANNPYSARWDLNIQRSLTQNLVLELGYVGNHSVHLDTTSNLNAVPRQYYSTSLVRDQNLINQMTANVANPFANLLPGTNLNGSTVQRNQLLKPFPEFTGVTQSGNLNDGSSFFNMLQVRLEKRFSHGLQVLANYSYSKLLEMRSRLNDTDPYFEKRVADEDRPQRLIVSASYQLPFAKHNRWLGGWVVNSIYTRQSGSPLAWGNVIYVGGDLNLNPRAIDGAFDTTRFNRVSAQQLDWNIRQFPTRFNNLRGDGPNNVDFSILKDTRLKERLVLQYRCEFFNAMNHPAFRDPSLSPTSSAFGTITAQANLPRSTQMALRLKW